MTDIEQIKQKVSILDLAAKFGAEPNKNGKCKYNPLREESTCSLKLYTETNTYADFGDKSGSVIDFYMKATNKDLHTTINDLKDLANIQVDQYVHTKVKEEKKIMTQEAVNRAFNSTYFQPLDFKEQKEHLKTVMPLYVLDEASKEDIKYFKEISRWSKDFNTSLYKFPDYKKQYYTFKYRYKFSEQENDFIKWYSLKDSKTSYLYCRLTNNNKTTLIVEGARDFLNAFLLGFDVIAIFSKNYNFSDEEYLLLKDRKCIFIDDLGETVLNKIYEKADCKEKIYFNHSKMGCEGCKDLSDYLYHFKSKKEFLEKFNNVIKDNGTWQDGINNKFHISIDFLQNAPKIESLTDNFLYKNTATILHSKPGAGKSSLVLALIRDYLINNKVDNVIYFDGDNPLSVIKDRVISLKNEFGDKILYYANVTAGREAMEQEMDRLCLFKGQGGNTLIIIDTLRKFVTGSLNNDSDVAPIMSRICNLRDKFGATVIGIHHSNKGLDEDGKPQFQGSQKISGDTDATWGLVRDGEKMQILQDKVRFGDMFEIINVKVDIKQHEILEFDGKYMSDLLEDDVIEEIIQKATKEDLLRFMIDKTDFIPMSQVQKGLNMHRNTNDKNHVWELIKDCSNIEYKRIGKGWKCKYICSEPEITQYVDMPEMF